jgi:LacI family transcriptional regulator
VFDKLCEVYVLENETFRAEGRKTVATIKDVANMAGVSMSTVSKYINGGNVRGPKAEAIGNAIAALDYRVNPFARSLKTQRSRSIGILLPDISAPFFGSVVTALDKTLREYGYHCLISCYSANHGMERDNLSYLISHGIDGLIYISEDLSAEEYFELTANCNVPMVQLDRMIQGVDTDAVLVDNSDIVYRAVSELISRGHRRIALVTGPKSVFTAKERQVGYLRALSDHSILYDDQLFISGGNTFATGYHSVDALIDLPNPPTAVLTTNYDITLGLVTAIRERGLRIPEDIDLFGFDSVEVCSIMRPPLPVVRQPEQLIGQTAAEYLIQRLQGYTGPARVTRLKSELVL